MIATIRLIHALALAAFALAAPLAGQARASIFGDVDPVLPVREPVSLLLLGGCLIALGLLMRHHRRRMEK